MATTQQSDAGLVQRGLLLLGGMTALVVVVLLIALRAPETSRTNPAQPSALVIPTFLPPAAFPATPNWPALAQLVPQLPSAPGWEIRYNAAVALARRGSSKTPWPVVAEMLDDEQQRRNFLVPLKKGQLLADEESAQRTVQNALAALAAWHEKHDRSAPPTISAELQQVYAQVDRLAQGSNNVLRVHADRVRQAFFRKGS